MSRILISEVGKVENLLPASPSELFPELLHEVQMLGIFDDGKTFVDAVARYPLAEIIAEFSKIPHTKEMVRDFVHANFDLPETHVVDTDTTKSASLPLREEIRRLWPLLVRQPQPENPGQSSALPVDRPHVVPGGRFRELYYWDSYFTMIGLMRDGHIALVDDMIEIFTASLEQYGQIPNGMRTYYLGRSQPPVYFLMLELRPARTTKVARRRLAAMSREYDFWMTGSEGLAPGQAFQHVVRLKCGSFLNRYWDNKETPRDESYREDTLVAKSSGRPIGDVYRDIRAGAESGWDFSSRWFQGKDLASIRTTSIAPVDLNCLVYGLERALASASAELGYHHEAERFEKRANARKDTITRLLWNCENGYFVDYDLKSSCQCEALTAATLYPLFMRLASQEQASATIDAVRGQLIASGGLRTTTKTSGEQWDMPNGWAPLQWIAATALDSYGYDDLAEEVKSIWVNTVDGAYNRTGHLFEKYDIEAGEPGLGGEYIVQEGFGWTNGVTASFIDDLAGKPVA